MKLQKKDQVMVISGKYKGTKGEVTSVLPQTNQVVVAGVNVVKRHTKPTSSDPKGGIKELVKPISASKVAILDPKSGRPARIGYRIDTSGKKERIFKVSPFKNPKPKTAKKTQSKAKTTGVKK